MSSLSYKRKQFLAASLLWAIALTTSSFQSHDLMWKILPSEALHAAAHIAAYGFFAYLISLWLLFARSFMTVRMTDARVLGIAFVLAVLWGCLNEGVQYYRPDRHADWLDVLCNAAGAAAGTGAYYLRKSFMDSRKRGGKKV